MDNRKFETLSYRFSEWRIVLVFLLLYFLAALFVPAFFDLRNAYAILVQMAPVGIVAVGMTFVIITGGIDLSVGSLVAMISVLMVGEGSYSTSFMLLFAILWGTLAGLFNGALVSVGRLPPFIATLSTMAIAKGIALWASNTQERVIQESSFAFFGSGKLLGIPFPVWLFVGICLLGQLVLRRTVFGKQVCAVGSNEIAAKHAGISVQRVKFNVYLIQGVLCAIAALVISSRLNISTPTLGEFYELDAIAAVVIGGTALMGGRGSVLGTFLGVLILGMITNVLNLQGASPYFQRIAKGAVIITAVLLQSGAVLTQIRELFAKFNAKSLPQTKEERSCEN